MAANAELPESPSLRRPSEGLMRSAKGKVAGSGEANGGSHSLGDASENGPGLQPEGGVTTTTVTFQSWGVMSDGRKRKQTDNARTDEFMSGSSQQAEIHFKTNNHSIFIKRCWTDTRRGTFLVDWSTDTD